MEIYDISQTLREGIPVWPGDPEFHQRWITRIQDGGSSNVSAISMGTHTGTHVDAPLHLENSGSDIAGIPICYFKGPARVHSISSQECIGTAELSMLDWQGVERILFKTRSGRPPEHPFNQSYVYLEENAADFLISRGILLVGTDAPSIDPYDSRSLPAHQKLLRHGIVILEGALLDHVPPGDYELVCLPLKLAGLDGSPVRAVLLK